MKKPIRTDEKWIDAQRRVRRMLLENKGILPEVEQRHGAMLIISEKMVDHPYAPWKPMAGWYIQLMEYWLTYAQGIVDTELGKTRKQA